MRVLVLLLVLAGTAHATEDWGTPIIELTDAFGRTSDEDEAERVFALYADGRVVYARAGARYGFVYDVAKLSPREVNRLVDDLPLADVGGLHPRWPGGADGSTQCIVSYANGSRSRACYWGLDDPQLFPLGSETAPPPAMLKVWQRLSRFKATAAKRWLPDTIELVILRRFGNLPPKTWPATWPKPTPTSSPTNQRVVGTCTLPGRLLPEVERVNKRIGPDEPTFLVDGVPRAILVRFDRPWPSPQNAHQPATR